MQPLKSSRSIPCHNSLSAEQFAARQGGRGWRLFRSRLLKAALCLGVWTGAAVGLETTPVYGQGTLSSASENDIFYVLTTRNEMSLTERFSRIIELNKRITRVDGFDPAIVTVSAISPQRIRVQAVSAGVTTLVLEDEFGKNYSVEIFVEGDVRHLQAYISRFFPDSSVSAVKVKDSVVLRGVVADPSHISQITEVAEQFFPKVINHMQFGAANQVRLQVRIMEAQRSRIRQLGFNWSFLSGSGYISSNPGSLAAPTATTLNSAGGNALEYAGSALSDSSVSFGLVNSNSIFRGFLEALKQENLLRILVETSVVADSGRPASLLSGGEFPILVPQALGTLSVEWREYGVKLEAVPIVLGQGQVILEIAPEFSERDFANAVSIQGTTVPGLNTRRANTQVRMKFGQTLMIGGLIAKRYTAETDKLPILGDLPGVGAAFRRVRYDENETELIILVTPEYVAPLDQCQVPEGGPGMFTDVPTDRELYLQGLLEVPNYRGPMPPQMHEYYEGMPHSPGMPGAPYLPGTLSPEMAVPPAAEEGPAPYTPDELPAIRENPKQPQKGSLPLQPLPALPEKAKEEASSIPFTPLMPAPASRSKAAAKTSENVAPTWPQTRESKPSEKSSGAVSLNSEQKPIPALPKPKESKTSEILEAPPALIAPSLRNPNSSPSASRP